MEESIAWGRPIGPFVQLRDDGVYLLDFGLDPKDHDVRAHVAAFGAFCRQNRQPLWGIVHLHALLQGTPKQRRMIADLDKELEAHDAQFMKICAIVAPNSLTRGLVTAVFWLSPPVYPYQIVGTLEQALSVVGAARRGTPNAPTRSW